MSSSDTSARLQLLDGLAEATDQLGRALAALGAAYEQLDEQQGDRLEDQLFHPVQRAYGRAKRTYTDFAGRHGLTTRGFTMPSPGVPSTGVKGFIEEAQEAVERADHELVALQESTLAIELSDVALRAGLTEVRQLIGEMPQHARAFLRTFGR